MSKEEEYEDRGDIVTDPDAEDEELEEAYADDEEDEDEVLDEDESEDEDDPEDDPEDDEEDDEEDDDDEEEEDEDNDEALPKVPLSRLNEVIEQRRERDERIQWLEEQLTKLVSAPQQGAAPQEAPQVESSFDFDAAEEQYVEAILSGEPEKATAIKRKINQESEKERQLQIETVKKLAREEAAKDATSSVEELRFEAEKEAAMEAHSFLDDESDDYNPKAVRMANALMVTNVQAGMTKADALADAVEEVAEIFKAKGEKPAAKKKSSTRAVASRKRAAKAAKATPPDQVSRRGKTEPKLDPSMLEKMSEREFNKLTAREKAKLRGDIV